MMMELGPRYPQSVEAVKMGNSNNGPDKPQSGMGHAITIGQLFAYMLPTLEDIEAVFRYTSKLCEMAVDKYCTENPIYV
jgi:hypothetical protein